MCHPVVKQTYMNTHINKFIHTHINLCMYVCMYIYTTIYSFLLQEHPAEMQQQQLQRDIQPQWNEQSFKLSKSEVNMKCEFKWMWLTAGDWLCKFKYVSVCVRSNVCTSQYECVSNAVCCICGYPCTSFRAQDDENNIKQKKKKQNKKTETS